MRHQEAGTVTSEYAAGTAGVVCMALALCGLVDSGYFLDFVTRILEQVNAWLPVLDEFPIVRVP